MEGAERKIEEVDEQKLDALNELEINKKEKFVNLLVEIIVETTLNEFYEKSH